MAAVAPAGSGSGLGSPLNAAQPGGPAGSPPLVRYDAAPEQSVLDVMAVLMRKHLILGWRRRRFFGAVVRVAIMSGVPLLVWFLQRSEEDRENVRGTLAALIMPVLGAMFIVTMFTQFVVEVVTDKELKMRYVQQIAGVSNGIYWLSFYLFYFVLSSFASLLFLLCTMKIAAIYSHSNPLLMFLTFTASFLQTFFLCMIVATLFSRARMAGVVCSMMGALVVGVFYTLLPLINTTDWFTYFAQSLIPFVSPLNLLNAIGTLENPGQQAPWGDDPPGFTWASFFTPISSLNEQAGKQRMQPPAGDQFLILLVDCLVYGLFAIWFDQVYQGEYGASKPWNFFLNPAYFFPDRARPDEESGQTPALQLENLVKEFGEFRAVDGMTLEVRRAEVFALLGHNGAGKTTAINCITGMLPLTSGSAKVCGIDVATDLQEARRHLSVCPQDNPLYLEYSVDDHLSFFAALRGVPPSASEGTITEALAALGLAEKRHARVATLSGGQKRRLWVATSLLGKTPVVFLDEPTSGMDPANRRKLWDLLLRMKASGRCILFTTHYLDEADVLAERKAVLHKGKVKAVGTSMELKRQFGLGYHLRVFGAKGADSRERVRAVLQSHIPTASDEAVRDEDRATAQDAPPMWSFILPYDQVDKYGPMLEDLERQAQELRVVDFSMETTTLEEVFMALGAETSGDVVAPEGQRVRLATPENYDPSRPLQIMHPETQQPVEVRLPPNAQPGQMHEVLLPAPVHDLDLVSPQERVPVSWLTSMEAVLTLRWRQVIQKPRSLLATLIVPGGLLFLQGWLFAKNLQGLANEDSGVSRNAREMATGIAGAGAGLWMSICLGIALPYFATTLVGDRVQRCLYVATSQGLRLSAFWTGTFAANMLHFMLLSFMVPACLIVFQAPYYSEFSVFLQYFPAALFCPVPMLLFAYTASRLFSTTEACSKFMPMVSLLASVVPFLCVYIMTILGVTLQIGAVGKAGQPSLKLLQQGKDLHQWANLIHWVMCFVDPFYLLPGTFAAIGLTQLTGFIGEIAKQMGLELDLLFPSIGGSYIAVPLLGASCLSCAFCLLLSWDMERTCGLLAHRVRGAPVTEPQLEMAEGAESLAARGQSFVSDADVASEQLRVASSSPGSYAVMYRDLVHTYNQGSSREVRAVRGISLGVTPGECFCLLGPNGAGKTTTLDVLTGAIFPPTQGEVRIGPHLATGSREERHAALKLLGNCPQVDPLWPTLTGRQHLLFYGKVKGLPPHLREQQAAAILRALGFSDFDADKATDAYSGGMKRKLSLGMALIGSPPTMLLDEPSAAVDAAAKRHLWRVVKRREPGQTVILTTHSMEEAEALSDRLAIQVRGRLRVIGTPDHIKMTHGAGYQLELQTNQTPQSTVEEMVRGLSPSARLLESHEGRFLFQLPVLKAVGAGEGELSLARLFLKMQEATRTMGLRDYSITRPSLEQVFLRLSREQEELEERFA